MQSHPCVYAIVLNWNNFADTKKCVDSLLAATYPNLKIIIIDNDSTDGSNERLQVEYPDLRFMSNPANFGFAKGCNVAIKEALKDKDAKYILLLNNDATVPPNFLEPAIEQAESDPSIGLIGGKIYHSPDSNILGYAGGSISLLRGQLVMRNFDKPDTGLYDEPEEITFVTCAAAVVTRRAIETAGLLPEEYFFGTEEQDYSLHVRRCGFKLYYVPGFICYHVSGGSHWNWSPKFVYNGYRNKLIFQEKYLPGFLFHLWMMAFKLYAKFAAKRRWAYLGKKHGWDTERTPPRYDQMHFALMQAIKDHRKKPLTEERLFQVEQEAQKAFP